MHRQSKGKSIISAVLVALLILAGTWWNVGYLVHTAQMAAREKFPARNLRVPNIINSLRDEIKKEPADTAFLVLLSKEDYRDLRFQYYHTPLNPDMPADVLPSSPDNRICHKITGRDVFFGFQSPNAHYWKTISAKKSKIIREKECLGILRGWNAGRPPRPIEYLLIYSTGRDGRLIIWKFDSKGVQISEEIR